ncbi:hypothetical protein VIGAN_02261100 [Vigna angularis var. angularis]|uniref:Zinc finger PHD-type domain-containing protein n=1 Tax=Vigna angularis var. angularis TaxID=157739 RepID=A0A0S3RGJ7_PHAAN|nr:hypothetical protein VIGAN_02261100 [Vigna angularis var. angularis]
MKLPKENIMLEQCDTCGARGLIEKVVTCSKCSAIRHVYCIQINTTIIPKDWLCETCQPKHDSTSPRKVNQDVGSCASKRKQYVKRAKVKYLDLDEVIRLSSAKASGGSKNVISKIPSLTAKSIPPILPPKVLGKLPRNNEVHKKTMTNQHDSCSLFKVSTQECIEENQQPFGGLVAGKNVQAHDPQKEKATKDAPFGDLSATKSFAIVGGEPSDHAECNRSNMEKSDPQSIQKNLNLYREFLPSSIHAWRPFCRGQIQILQTAASSIIYDGFEAQPPCIVNKKAYKLSREMPSVLQLESLPALNVLTDIFPDDSPNLQDIALYFFPSEHTDRSFLPIFLIFSFSFFLFGVSHVGNCGLSYLSYMFSIECRFRKDLNDILKFMNDNKAMLRSFIGGVELLVFTSNQLDVDSRGVIAEVKAGHFLWGVFRQFNSDEGMETVDMEIDMIGGKDVEGKVDRIMKDKPKRLII